MWGTFALGVLFLTVVLFLPGYWLLSFSSLPASRRIACAPLLSVLGFEALAYVFAWTGHPAPWWQIVLPVCVFALCLEAFSVAIRRKLGAAQSGSAPGNRRHELRAVITSLRTPLLYVCVAAVIVAAIFLRSLDSAMSFSQDYDNYSHLNAVRDLANNQYYVDLERGIYPQGWHCLAVLCAELLGGQVTVAINALSFVLIAVVFPLGVYAFVSNVFSDKRHVLAGAICSVAFAAFPWGFVTFGPLYPCLAAFAMLPAAECLFMSIFQSGLGGGARFARSFYFVLGAVSLALLHQSAIFTGVVLLAPYCCHLLWSVSPAGRRGERLGKLTNIFMVAAFALLLWKVWEALVNDPNFQDVVTFGWESFQSAGQAVASIMLVSLTRDSVPQVLLGICVLLGIVRLVLSRCNLWLVVSYVLAGLIYVLCTSGEGYWKFFASGFWYNDSFRISAVVALAAMPLACVGMSTLESLVRRAVNALGLHISGGTYESRCAWMMGMGFVLLLLYLPCVETGDGHGVTSPFGVIEQTNLQENTLADDQNTYDLGEIEFVERAKEVVPEDAVVINLPYDGSMFAYGVNNFDVRYRSWWFDSGTNINASGDADSIIRSRLSDFATDPDVQEAVRETGAEYVLLLDQGVERDIRIAELENNGEKLPKSVYTNVYTPRWWRGITSIDDTTPGFEVVLAEGDMRLYKIVG